MKVIRKLKGTPGGDSLSIQLLYGLGDIKSALVQIMKKAGGIDSVSMTELIQMLYNHATDSHMPKEPRRFIAEWMARVAVSEGYVFKANEYLGNATTKEDAFLFDEEAIREKMRGRPKKTKAN